MMLVFQRLLFSSAELDHHGLQRVHKGGVGECVKSWITCRGLQRAHGEIKLKFVYEGNPKTQLNYDFHQGSLKRRGFRLVGAGLGRGWQVQLMPARSYACCCQQTKHLHHQTVTQHS